VLDHFSFFHCVLDWSAAGIAADDVVRVHVGGLRDGAVFYFG
jgi:hypothetical protein